MIGELGQICEAEVRSSEDGRLHGETVAGLFPLVEEGSSRHKEGERLKVFLALDEDGKTIACTRLPLAGVGDFAVLRVKKVMRAGAIFDLGNGYELPVATEEIPFRPKDNERTLVRVELDADGGLCGSCRIDDFLEVPAELRVGQQVQLQVWRQTDLGTKMIIDNRYEGLLYASELVEARAGQVMTGYVSRLREDGKVDLSLSPGGKAAVDLGREKILQSLEVSGFLKLHDGSTPEEIRRVLGLSKKQFKRAVGGLYKEGKLELVTNGIRLKR